jgi:hypothetical protein
LGETRDGSCPNFAASNDVTGNPYGVIGSWDVSAVKSMKESKCTLFSSLWPRRLPSWCGLIYTTTPRVSSDHNSHTFCCCCVLNGTFLWFVVGCGLVLLSFCCTVSCSVLFRSGVQSGRVQMEYGCSDNDV